MMNQAWIERQSATPEARREFEQERLVLRVTEMIYEAMEAAGISKSDLARKLGTSRAHITSLLSGSPNMTLRTLADLGWALEQRIGMTLEPLRDGAFISAPDSGLSALGAEVGPGTQIGAGGRREQRVESRRDHGGGGGDNPRRDHPLGTPAEGVE